VVEGGSQSGHWQQTESDGGPPIYFKALNLLTLLTYAESALARQGDQKEAVKRLCRDEETLLSRPGRGAAPCFADRR
jgi:hypothetical protein